VDYLRWFSVPAPRTLYRGIRSLQPGEILHLEDGHHAGDGAWTLERLPTRKPNATRAACAEELKEELRSAIRAHMLADVPVGAFLSGGVDSSLITALMCRESGSRLKTFSVGLEDEALDESSEAAQAAAFLGTDHHCFRLTGNRVAHDIGTIVAAMDQPTGDGVNTYYASLAAREGGVTVALSGLGGDEIFGGYPSFGDIPRLGRMLPRWRLVPSPLRSLAVAALRRGDMRKLKLADFLDYAADASEAAALHRRVNSEPSVSGLLKPEFRTAATLGSPLHPRHARIASALEHRHAADIASAYELQGYMADVLLHDSDMMSMRHSLELRVPFVDLPLLAWAWSQKPEHKYTPGQPKHLLTLAFRDILPPGTTARRKRGFSLPFDSWMRAELRPFLEHVFTPASIAACPLLDVAEVQGRWASYLAKRDPREWSRVWSLAMLISACGRKQAA
jgi:asparagine synthase (glutamine-hydrolysing)